MTTGTTEVRRFLVIKHGAFGDIMQSEGALHDIRDNHPDAAITLLTTPPYRRILERCPWVDRVMIDTRPSRWRLDLMIALGRRLRAERFQLVYDLQNSTRTAFYRRWLMPDVPWSGQDRRRTLLLRARPQSVPSLPRMARQLRDAGLDVRHAERPDLSWMADDVAPVLAAAGIDRRFVVLIPGSSARHPQKRWPFYPELAEALLRRGLAVVTAPGPDELALARSMPGTVLTGPNGYLNWFELAGLFRRAAFIVGNDTGPTHLAAHVGAPGLALFGSHTPPEMTGILRPGFTALAVPDLRGLPAEKVFAAVSEQLAGQGAPA